VQRRKKDADIATGRHVDVVGVKVDMETNQPIVLLKETGAERHLAIWVGQMEATAIALGQQGMVPKAPLTHDLMRDIFKVLGVRLTAAHIRALEDGVFHSYLTFSNGKEVRARPSDSIALALRTGAPIYVRDEILEECGVLPDEPVSPEQPPTLAHPVELPAEETPGGAPEPL